MNLFLADAPHAEVVHGELACMVSLNDLADRPPHVIGDEVLDLGRHRLRFLPTPHVPHNWESGLWFDETTGTLFAGDLFTHIGDGPAVDRGRHRRAGARRRGDLPRHVVRAPTWCRRWTAWPTSGPTTLAADARLVVHG